MMGTISGPPGGVVVNQTYPANITCGVSNVYVAQASTVKKTAAGMMFTGVVWYVDFQDQSVNPTVGSAANYSGVARMTFSGTTSGTITFDDQVDGIAGTTQAPPANFPFSNFSESYTSNVLHVSFTVIFPAAAICRLRAFTEIRRELEPASGSGSRSRTP
jgi:hypothetical protein